jgi:hypothetical protein
MADPEPLPPDLVVEELLFGCEEPADTPTPCLNPDDEDFPTTPLC